jgi:hypothetical protein
MSSPASRPCWKPANPSRPSSAEPSVAAQWRRGDSSPHRRSTPPGRPWRGDADAGRGAWLGCRCERATRQTWGRRIRSILSAFSVSCRIASVRSSWHNIGGRWTARTIPLAGSICSGSCGCGPGGLSARTGRALRGAGPCARRYRRGNAARRRATALPPGRVNYRPWLEGDALRKIGGLAKCAHHGVPDRSVGTNR